MQFRTETQHHVLRTPAPRWWLRSGSALVLAIGISACGSSASDPVSDSDAGLPATDAKEVVEGGPRSPFKPVVPSAVPVKQDPAVTSGGPLEEAWIETAVRDMRRPDGSLEPLRTLGTLSSAAGESFEQRGSLGLPLTSASWQEGQADPILSVRPWLRVLEGEGPDAFHQPGYAGNSRVRVWGLEIWVMSGDGAWHRLTPAETPPVTEAAIRGEPTSVDTGGLQYIRVEPDGAVSFRPDPVPPAVDLRRPAEPLSESPIVPPDAVQVLVLLRSQLILHDPAGADDRARARFQVGIGATWLQSAASEMGLAVVGERASTPKFVTTEPQLHIVHSLTESQLRADPPPR